MAVILGPPSVIFAVYCDEVARFQVARANIKIHAFPSGGAVDPNATDMRFTVGLRRCLNRFPVGHSQALSSATGRPVTSCRRWRIARLGICFSFSHRETAERLTGILLASQDAGRSSVSSHCLIRDGALFSMRPSKHRLHDAATKKICILREKLFDTPAPSCRLVTIRTRERRK